MNLHFRKRVSPCFVFQSNQLIHPRIGAGAEAAQSRPKETTEKSKRNKCRQRRINKNEEASRSLRPPKISHQAPRLRSTGTNQHLKRDRDEDDAAAKGFPRYTTRREEGLPPTPSRKVRRHPPASPRRCRTGRQGFTPIPTFTSDAPEPATKPTTILRQHGQEASTPSHHGTTK